MSDVGPLKVISQMSNRINIHPSILAAHTTATCANADEFLDLLLTSQRGSITFEREIREFLLAELRGRLVCGSSTTEEIERQLDIEIARYQGRTIFRGVRSAKWHASTSLARHLSEDKSLLNPNHYARIPRRHFYQFSGVTAQRNVEDELLLSFFAEADRAGLPVPKINSRLAAIARGNRSVDARLRPRSNRKDLIESGQAFDIEDLELMAIAQHYGTPTRLLDWT